MKDIVNIIALFLNLDSSFTLDFSQGVSDLASKAKETVGNVVDGARASFNDLKSKLQTQVDVLKGHVSKLGDHATNAVSALKDAISNIASEWLPFSVHILLMYLVFHEWFITFILQPCSGSSEQQTNP